MRLQKMDTTLKNLTQQADGIGHSRNVGTPHGSHNSSSIASALSHDHVECTFRPWTMIAFFSLHWIASWVIFTFGVVMILKPLSADRPCHVFYLLVYLRAGFWLGTYMLNEKIKDPCRKLINNNYTLYRNMTSYRKAPLQIVSFWNTTLIAINGYAKDFFEKNGMESSGNCRPIDNDLVNALTSPQLMIVIFCGIESIALSCFYAVAMIRLIPTLRISSEQYEVLPNELSAEHKLKQQAEQIKLLQRENKRLEKQAAEIGLLED